MVWAAITTEMNSENMISIRNSFSIENILSKPSKNQLIENHYKSECANECSENNSTSDEVSTITGGELVLKKEPHNGLVNDDHLMTNNDFSNNRSQFTSPDSSGCEEENGENLSDTTTGDNCKLILFWIIFIYILAECVRLADIILAFGRLILTDEFIFALLTSFYAFQFQCVS